MSTIDLTTYEGQVARLDTERIAEVGRWVDTYLAPAGDTVALDYQPDNGTAYHLLFIPALSIDQLGPNPIPAGIGLGSFRPRRPIGERWAVVAKVNCAPSDWVHPFDLTPGTTHHVSYVAEHIGAGLADAAAITALFRAVCGVPFT